jgi:hypothetical protein
VREKEDNDEGGVSFAASFNQAAAMAMNVACFSGSEHDFTRSRHSAAWRSNCSRLLSGSAVIQKACAQSGRIASANPPTTKLKSSHNGLNPASTRMPSSVSL